MKKFIYFLTSFLLFFTLFSVKVFAAEISVALPPTVDVGENFEVLINMNSDEILINSASITLDYDEKLLSFSGYKSENTVVGIWVDYPHEENGTVVMSGIIPGGVSGLYDPNKDRLGPIPLVRLLFSAKQSGSANFAFLETEILQHDGSGTALTHGKIDGEILIENNPTDTNIPKEKDIIDKEKPELLEVKFLESSPFSETPSMIIFQAEDSGSGIKEYQINTGGSEWVNVESPHPIPKGIFSQAVAIRAFDFYGNFQESVVTIPGILSPIALWILAILLIVLCIGCYKVLKYRQ